MRSIKLKLLFVVDATLRTASMLLNCLLLLGRRFIIRVVVFIAVLGSRGRALGLLVLTPALAGWSHDIVDVRIGEVCASLLRTATAANIGAFRDCTLFCSGSYSIV